MAKTPYVLLNEQAQAPHKAHNDDAGFDLTSTQSVSLKPLERVLVPTGIAIAIPSNRVGMVCPRSGLAIKQGITVLNAPGIIDPGYTGEVKVALINLSHETVELPAGSRIAQLVITPTSYTDLAEKSTLPATVRDGKGFGSTGIANHQTKY